MSFDILLKGQVVTNAEAWFNNSLRPRKPEGSLGRTAQDVHLDSHTAPELCQMRSVADSLIMLGDGPRCKVMLGDEFFSVC